MYFLNHGLVGWILVVLIESLSMDNCRTCFEHVGMKGLHLARVLLLIH